MSNFISNLWQMLDQWTRQSGAQGLSSLLLVIALIYIAWHFRLRSRQQVIDLQNQQLAQENQTLSEQQLELTEELQDLRNFSHEKSLQLAREQQSLQSKNQQIDDLQSRLDKLQAQLDQQRAENLQLNREQEKLDTSLKEKQLHFDEQVKLLSETREQLKKEFELLANDILENKGKAFRDINQQSIQQLLNPVQAEMKSFREKVETIHSEDLRQRSALQNELLNLQKLNQQITDKAESLTNALQGQKKIQGNWGELILEKVLDNSGLRSGVDYQREVSIKNEEGKTQRPDAIVYLPQKKHLIIDAKTSLVNYTRYVNAENDLERANALAEHSKAVSDRIEELADRDYYKLPGLNSPEVVIMFIPIESAYVEALKHDETLYQRAIEKNVLVATPTTLLTSLNIVRQLWQFEDRNKHTAELAKRAGRFHQKLNGFLGSMQKIGNQLDGARETYDKALSLLYSGKGNLIKQAAEFRDLGVSVQKELPAELIEMASLELEETTTNSQTKTHSGQNP